MASIRELRDKLSQAAQMDDPLDRRLWVLAVITEALAPTGLKPVLVGGAAVEFYTSGGYATFDMDLVADTDSLDLALTELGFTKHARHWVHDDLSLAIEAPSSELGAEAEHVLELQVGDMKAFLIGVEDIIIDRLNACVHWRSAEDCRWALHLIAENKDQIDWDYLRRRAVEERVDERLEQIISQLPEDRK